MRKGEQRKAEIVAGLQAVMAETGYERASIAAIGRAAGLTPGLVHYHFSSKQAVLLALVDRLIEGLRARFAGLDGPDLSPPQRLDALIDALLALGPDADPSAAACWAQIGAEAQRQPAVAERFAAATEETRAQLERLLTDCGAADPAHAAVGLLAAIEGAYRLAAAAPATVPPGQAAALVKRMARGLLR